MPGSLVQTLLPGYVGVFTPSQFSSLDAADYPRQHVAVEAANGAFSAYRSDGASWTFVGLIGESQIRASPELFVGPTASSLRRQRLAPSPIGFNSYELLYRGLLGEAYDYAALLTYFQQCRANFVRIMFPVFHAQDWLDYVFEGEAVPVGELTDADFYPAFLEKTDMLFSAVADSGLKLLTCVFWNTAAVANLFSESVVNSLKTDSASYAFMLRFVRWFGRRYGEHPALGAYSFFCEQNYSTSDSGLPTPNNLGDVTRGLIAEMRAYAPMAVATTDLNPLSLMTEADRQTFVSEMENLRAICMGCDALGVHLYGYGPSIVGSSFVGYDGAATSAFGPATTNQLGFEAVEGYLSSMRSVADSMGIPLWLTETGVPTDVDPPNSALRRSRLLTACQKYAEVSLVWNAANVPVPQPNQEIWQIQPGSTLAATYLPLVAGLNAGRLPPAAGGLGAGTTPLRLKNRPRVCMTSTRTAGATVQVIVNEGFDSPTQGWLAWVRRNDGLNDFEVLFDCRHQNRTQRSGMVYLAGVDSGADAEYGEFITDTGDSAGNSYGKLPRIENGDWYHIGLFYRTINGHTAIEVWQNGLLFGAFAVTGGYAPIQDGTPIFVLGGSASGAPVSMQDVALVPYASPEDIWAHLEGAVLPQSQLHLRADATGAIRDLAHQRLEVDVGLGVITEVA